MDHFIAFITSPHIIQDLPFGERTIMLSTKETIKVPNVIRMIISERIVIQYMTYCQESGFTPLSRATLLRILSKCAASFRTSVQSLDYVSAASAEAFDDLCDVVETLGDVGQGIGWAKQQGNNLRASKRYLKSDFKVGVARIRQIPYTSLCHSPQIFVLCVKYGVCGHTLTVFRVEKTPYTTC